MSTTGFFMVSLLLVVVFLEAVPIIHAQKQTQEQTQNQEQEPTTTSNINHPHFLLSGYLPDYRFSDNLNLQDRLFVSRQQYSHQQQDDQDEQPWLTDLILFSIEPHSSGRLGGCCLNPTKHYQPVQQAIMNATSTSTSTSTSTTDTHTDTDTDMDTPNQRRRRRTIRLWVTVGGAGRSHSFFTMAADPMKRERFIQSMSRLCQRESIDGIDLDVYHPQTPQDVQYYFIFLQEASRIWRQEQGLLLSVALSPNHPFPKSISKAYEWVDYVHFMTYTVPLSRNNNPNGDEYFSWPQVEPWIHRFLEFSSCPKSKLILGIPFFGTNVQNPNDVKTFEELYNIIVNQNNLDHDNDDDSIMDTLSNFRGYQWVSPNTIRTLLDHAYQEGLAGVVFWELGQDKITPSHPGGFLLESSLSNHVRVRSKPKPTTSSSDVNLEHEL